MKKYPKLVQCDARGQLVIPKDIRTELKVEEGTGFWIYSIENEGLFLKKMDAKSLEEHWIALSELEQKSERIGIDKKNLRKSVEKYKKTKEGKLDVV